MRVQFHSRPRVFNDYTGLAQSNERDDSPIPAAIPFFMLGLTELKISSRNPISDRIKKEHAGHEHDAERDLPTVGETGCRCRWNRGKNEEKFSPMPGA